MRVLSTGRWYRRPPPDVLPWAPDLRLLAVRSETDPAAASDRPRLHAWQEDGEQAEQPQERADPEDVVDALVVGDDAEHGSTYAAEAEGEPEEDAGDHADAA